MQDYGDEIEMPAQDDEQSSESEEPDATGDAEEAVNYAENPQQAQPGGVVGQVASQVSNAASNMAAAFMGSPPVQAITRATTRVAEAIHIPQAAVNVGLAVTLVAGGGVGAGAIAEYMAEDDWVLGKPDCAVANQEAQKKYGFGEREIPETVGDLTIGDGAGCFGSPMATMMGRNGSNNWNLGTQDRSVVQHVAFQSNGGDPSINYKNGYVEDPALFIHDSGGFYRLNVGGTPTEDLDSKDYATQEDYFLLGVSPAGFGRSETDAAHVGDWITFYWEDGTCFESIVFDTKGAASGTDINGNSYDYLSTTSLDTQISLADPQGEGRRNVICAYGHVAEDNTVNVLEFLAGTEYVGSGHGGSYPTETPYAAMGHDGDRVVSFTNHGLAPEIRDSSLYEDSIFLQAEDARNAARETGARKAADECKSDCTQSFDNSSIVEAALSVAYSQSPEYGADQKYPGTDMWLEVFEKTIGDSYPRSCDRGVCGILRWAGIDDNYPAGDTGEQLRYVTEGIRLGTWEKVEGYDPNQRNVEVLEPGDVFLRNGHTSLYVGNDAIKAHTFEGDANVGAVAEGAYSVSASISSGNNSTDANCRAPGVGLDAGGGGAYAYRCVKPQTTPSKYTDTVNTASMDKGCEKKKSSGLENISDQLNPMTIDGWLEPLPRGSYSWSQSFSASHSGVDLGCTEGTKVAATGPGKVAFIIKCPTNGPHPNSSDACGGCGNCVVIDHDNGMATVYMHMSEHADGLKEGMQVYAGDVIGKSGNTGQSFGGHLHFTMSNAHLGVGAGWGGWQTMYVNNRVDPATFNKNWPL